MKEYALIGNPLSHSFSQKYFTAKFTEGQITDCVYNLYELPDIQKLPALLSEHPNLHGLNVTVPHKEAVIPFLDEIDPEAGELGAVNVIKFNNGKTKGFNSDFPAFRQTLQEFYPINNTSQALILGTGGASKAVKAAFQSLNIPFKFVSRQPQSGQMHYEEITPIILADFTLIVNTTPLGTYPNIQTFPALPYESLTDRHYLYDLVYNPAETVFLQKGKEVGAKIKNGYDMLVLQAEISWQIWNS